MFYRFKVGGRKILKVQLPVKIKIMGKPSRSQKYLEVLTPFFQESYFSKPDDNENFKNYTITKTKFCTIYFVDVHKEHLKNITPLFFFLAVI